MEPTREPSFSGTPRESFAFCPQLSAYFFPLALALAAFVVHLAWPPEPVYRVFECRDDTCRILDRGAWNQVTCAYAEDAMNAILGSQLLRRGKGALHGGTGKASEVQDAFQACRHQTASRYATSVNVVEDDWRGAVLALVASALVVLGTAPRRFVRVRVYPLKRKVVAVEWTLRGKQIRSAAVAEIEDVVVLADSIALRLTGGRHLALAPGDTRLGAMKRRTVDRLRRALGRSG